MSDGNVCPQCGGLMQRTGTCFTCPSCGYDTGCGRAMMSGEKFWHDLGHGKMPIAFSIINGDSRGLVELGFKPNEQAVIALSSVDPVARSRAIIDAVSTARSLVTESCPQLTVI